MTSQAHSSPISYAVMIAIVLVVMGLRLRGMGKLRPLNPASLWIIPALYLGITVLLFIELPPTFAVAAASAFGLAIGAAIGWWRGKMMHIEVDPETRALNQKASPGALVFLVALVLVRTAGRSVAGQSGVVSPAMLTDPLVAFALGMFSLTRLEMFLRARKLLQQARNRA